MTETTQRQKRFWLSWYHTPDLGCFELHFPFWDSGVRLSDDASTICAAIIATNEMDAKNTIDRAYDSPPGQLEWRFCEEQKPGWSPFGDRFQKANWMVWP